MGVFNDKVLFVHIPKTAGTSVKQWMFDHLPGTVGQRPDDPESSQSVGFPIGHIRLQDIADPPPKWREEWGTPPRPPESFEKIIAILRNPYEQQVSQFTFWLRRAIETLENANLKQGADPYQMIPFEGKEVPLWRVMHPHDGAAYRAFYHQQGNAAQAFRWWLCDPMCDFHMWYEDKFVPKDKWKIKDQPEGHHDSYYRYWVEVNGEIPDNVEILRIEDDLDGEWRRIMSDYVDDPPPLPIVNSSGEDYDLGAYYNADFARRVENKFRWAFENYYDRWTL